MGKTPQHWGGSRQWNPDHVKSVLADKVPLATPYMIYVDPTNACNFRCKFCPTGHPDVLKRVGREVKTMSMKVFTKVIDDLKAFPDKIRVFSFHKDGEPLLNPRLGEMMRYAVEQGVAERYWLTTNASLITPEKAREIVASGIDYVRLSIEHVDAEGYKEYTQTFSDYDRIVSNVRTLFEERERQSSKMQIFAKVIDFNFTPDQIEKFGNDFGDIADEVLLTANHAWSAPESGDFSMGIEAKIGYDGERPLYRSRVACYYPFYMMAVNSDGGVGLCALDWSHATCIDNVMEKSLLDIWNGKKARAFQVLHLAGRRHENSACKNCLCVSYDDKSELDPARERLLPVFEELERNAT